MILGLRTFGADDNPAGASTFCSIPVPIGTKDGDLVVVALVLPAAALTITPPSDDWELVLRTDPALALGVAVYKKVALSEQTRWVFGLSASVAVVGNAIVFTNADDDVIDATASAFTTAASTHNVPSITAADEDENVLYVFAASSGGGTFITPSGFGRVVGKSQASARLETQRKERRTAGVEAATTSVFCVNDDPSMPVVADGVCVAITLHSTVSTLSVDDVRERIVGALPERVDDVYDLTPTGDYYKFFQSIAATWKAYAFDLVARLRREAAVLSARLIIPSWEAFFGLETTRAARSGTMPQRRAGVTAAFRAAAGQGSSEPVVQSVLSELLGYNAGTKPEIIGCERGALRLANSYLVVEDVALPVGATTVRFNVTRDAGHVSSAGAHLTLVLATSDVRLYTFQLVGPDGTTKTWSGAGIVDGPLELRSPEFGGKILWGQWTLTITNASGGANTLYAGSALFVEGIGGTPWSSAKAGQDTGGAIFHWGVYADPAHLGENGVGADLPTAARAVEALAHAEGVGRLILSKAPRPGVSGGQYAAIPGQCIPV